MTLPNAGLTEVNRYLLVRFNRQLKDDVSDSIIDGRKALFAFLQCNFGCFFFRNIPAYSLVFSNLPGIIENCTVAPPLPSSEPSGMIIRFSIVLLGWSGVKDAK